MLAKKVRDNVYQKARISVWSLPHFYPPCFTQIWYKIAFFLRRTHNAVTKVAQNK